MSEDMDFVKMLRGHYNCGNFSQEDFDKAADALEQAQDKNDIDRITMDNFLGQLKQKDKRMEQLGAVLQRIADSGIESNFAWAWIGGIAKQILQSAGDSASKDTRPYKERFPEQYCLNCGQWLGGGAACCSEPKSPTAKVIETVPDTDT